MKRGHEVYQNPNGFCGHRCSAIFLLRPLAESWQHQSQQGGSHWKTANYGLLPLHVNCHITTKETRSEPHIPTTSSSQQSFNFCQDFFHENKVAWAPKITSVAQSNIFKQHNKLYFLKIYSLCFPKGPHGMDDVGFLASFLHALPALGQIILLSQVMVRITRGTRYLHLQDAVTGVALNYSPPQMCWEGFHEQNAFVKLGS